MQLKEYLKKNKISKEDFATSVGASYGSVIKWTYGGRFPRPQALQKIHELTEGQVTAYDFIQQVQK
jgi:transcriptional regulator with XRE-family HTH domain